MFQHKQTAGLKNSSSSLKTAQKLTFLLAVLIYLPLNAQLDFGDNKWNVYAFNNLSAVNDPTFTEYRGYYTQKLNATQDLGFNTTRSWGTASVPSSATAFTTNGEGSTFMPAVAAPNQVINATDRKFSYIHKRKGFPVGKYKLFMKEWDDNTQVFINGARMNFDGETGWGSNRLIVNCFELDANSTIEVRTGNNGAGITQAILEITRTDILFATHTDSIDVCKGTSTTLNGDITIASNNFSHNLYALNFDDKNPTYMNVGWTIATSSTTLSSGSKLATTSGGSTKTIQFSFLTLNKTNLKLSFRHSIQSNAGAKLYISSDSLTWSNIKSWTGNSGNPTVFAPEDIALNSSHTSGTKVYLRFEYTGNTQCSIDDILVTGQGPAPITYSWFPTTGLSNASIANPTVTINNDVTYTMTVTAGNCTVSNTVPVHMIQIPAQPTITSSPAWFEYAVVNVPNVTYAWTTSPATGVGSFPYGNTTSTVTFIPSGAGNLIVTASNQCGTGTELVFNNPLPVTLTNFSANCSNGLTINWSTASEQNSDYYLVEKSRDMQNWTTVNKQNAAGNSNTSINYSAVDATAWNGLAYYRLRQFDFNGDEKIYDPISISCEGTENAMTVYPNPSKGEFTVEVTSNENALTQLEVIDLTGKIISSQDLSLTAGVNQVYFKSFDLTSGVYIVRVIGGNAAIQPVRVVIE